MSKQYILSNIQPKLGHINQAWIWDLTWVDPDDLTVYMMVVDQSYRNYARWRHIIDTNMLGSYAGLRRSSRQDQHGQRVVTADSQPQLTCVLTEHEIMDIIELRQQQLGL